MFLCLVSPQIYYKLTTFYPLPLSFAIVMWEILSRALPYEHLKTNWAIREFVVAGQRPTLPEPSLGLEYNELMTRCWSADPKERPSFADSVIVLTSLSANESLGDRTIP